MRFDHRVDVPAPISEVWAFVIDVPRVGACLPGLESLRQLNPDTYAGVLRARVGPIKANLDGTLEVLSQERQDWSMRMRVAAVDRRINSSLQATTTLALVEAGEAQTELVIDTDAAMAGKLGQFGQAVLRATANDMLCSFAERLAQELGGTVHPAPGPASTSHREPGRVARLWRRLAQLLRRGRSVDNPDPR